MNQWVPEQHSIQLGDGTHESLWWQWSRYAPRLEIFKDWLTNSALLFRPSKVVECSSRRKDHINYLSMSVLLLRASYKKGHIPWIYNSMSPVNVKKVTRNFSLWEWIDQVKSHSGT
jgi:hypothetical protein